jgi:hypothetical protein
MTSLWDKFADALYPQRYNDRSFWGVEYDVQRDDYAARLLHSRGQDEKAVDREINRVLFRIRIIEPWQRWFYQRVWKYAVNLWRYAHGQYRRSRPAVHGSAAGQPGAGAGTVTSAAMFTGYRGGFTAGTGGTTAAAGKTFEDAGIRAGEVTAYRCWDLSGDDGFLYSVYRSDVCWRPGEIMEGDAENGEGIHAFKDIVALSGYGDSWIEVGVVLVTGTVELWGDVFEHERGYRASKAKIASIFDSPNYDAAELRKRYGLNRRKKAGKK